MIVTTARFTALSGLIDQSSPVPEPESVLTIEPFVCSRWGYRGAATEEHDVGIGRQHLPPLRGRDDLLRIAAFIDARTAVRALL